MKIATRFALAAAIFLALIAPSAALTDDALDTVVVTGDALAGVWQIQRPEYAQLKGLFSDVIWGPPRTDFCRFETGGKTLTAHCMPHGIPGSLSLDGTHVHLAWGTMLGREILDGELQGPGQFTAHYNATLVGVAAFTDPVPMQARQLTLAQDAPDAGGNAALLKTILSGGVVQRDDDAIKKSGFPSVIPALGAVQAVIYLGPWNKPKRPVDPAPATIFQAYVVEFDSGERLCALHQRGDGVLDGFLCV